MTDRSEQLHWDAEEMRRRGHEAIDWVVDYLSGVENRSVTSSVAPGDIASALPAHPPSAGESFDEVIEDLDRVVMPGITHWQHPSWFAFFNSNTSGPSMMADIISSGLAVQGMLWKTSPACTEVETRMMDWLVEMLGLPASFLSTGKGGGVIQDTASSATLCALVAAREQVTDFGVNRHGVQQPMTVYGSSQAHSSVEKAVRIAGLGGDQFRHVDLGTKPKRFSCPTKWPILPDT
ncbi:MAG: pyridoxal-dependent decarboxylase [Planctomycetota bacterium]